ncbi:MAG: hypothetical protein BWY71_01331 [Planctomycetes bacterium ADurb.Bin412]|nr:MAG: hypothetical protein BWY71_01331 [Planctomycetes bacterium ADurb.Bin412]
MTNRSRAENRRPLARKTALGEIALPSALRYMSARCSQRIALNPMSATTLAMSLLYISSVLRKEVGLRPKISFIFCRCSDTWSLNSCFWASSNRETSE